MAQGERRMLIDGELVLADSGKTFNNVNPATEEVLGDVTDASAAEMHRAIDAARRSFDESDWSTNHAFRQKCLEQLQEALEAEREELREELIARGRVPPDGHQRAAAGRPARRRAALAGQAHRLLPLGHRPGRGGRRHDRRPRDPAGLEGAGRRRRRHHAVELPGRGDSQQGGADAGDRQHDGAQAGSGHPLERHPTRPADRRAHRHPRRCRQRRHRPPTTSSARSSPCRPRSTSSPSPAPPWSAAGSWKRAPRP